MLDKLSFLNPFIKNHKFNFVKNYYLLFVLIFLFFALRIPLLESHFFHCDDNSKMPTYPVLSNLIGHFFWAISEILHYKFFKATPSFIFELFFTRASSLLLTFLSFWTTLVISKNIFRNNLITFLVGILFCCSQMLIIYSINSGPYGYSILPVNLMILYLLKANNIKFNKLIFFQALLLLVPIMSISAIFILPAFSILILYNKKNHTLEWKSVPIITLLLLESVFIYFQKILPVSMELILNNEIFGHKPTTIAINWNSGINNQFVFLKESLGTFFTNPLETTWFFLKNFILIIENNLSPSHHLTNFSESQIVFFCIPILLAILIGLKSLFKNNISMAIFISLSILSIFLLVYYNFLTLSPTRHNIWFNSFFLILLASFFSKINLRIRNKAIIIFSLSIVFFTLHGYKNFYNERQSKIDFSYLNNLDKKHHLDYIFSSGFSDNVKKLYIFKYKNFLVDFDNRNLKKNFKIALISHRRESNDFMTFSNFLKQFNYAPIRAMSNFENTDNFLEDYLGGKITYEENTLYSEKSSSECEVGRTKFCKNGTNGRYVKVIQISNFKFNE